MAIIDNAQDNTKYNTIMANFNWSKVRLILPVNASIST
jgi:hypothetical protein